MTDGDDGITSPEGDDAATGDLDRVLASVHEEIDPDPDERERLASAASDVLDRAREAIRDLSVEADVVQVGSTARDTWIAGDRDLDVFVRFPPDLDRSKLREYGLEVGHAVLPDGREEYAEHPYVTGEYAGFDVDLVPCYGVEDATDIRSAVDRTPFHTEYLRNHLDGDLAADARLCKAFLKGIGAYGSDLRTRGFSGYLTELLVVEYDGFRPLLEAAADWHPTVRLDPGDTGSDATFEDPLVVIDPTDPDRNVAAVCSADNVARFQHYARELLSEPRTDLFEARDPDPISPADVREHLQRRGTSPVAIRFPAPDVVEDQLYPQLRRTLSGVVEELERRGFRVLRSEAFANDDAVLFLELAIATLPAVERHEGPPVAVRDHAEGFYSSYADSDTYGPFLDGGDYVVERDREFESAADFLGSEALFDVGIGPAVERSLESRREVLVGDEVADLAGEFGTELAAYFDPAP